MKENQKNENLDRIVAEKIAAHQLMTQFVKDNASDVANAIEELAPFICSECNLSSLKGDLNTVNVTFATIALDVIRVRNDKDNESNLNLTLPVDAVEMQNALYDLSRFIKMFSPMATFMEMNRELPAFKMSIYYFDRVDSL